MAHELIRRVIGVSAACLIPLAVGGFALAGPHGVVGVLAGGAVALGNLWLLGRGADRAVALFTGGQVLPLWMLGVGLRYLALFAAIVFLLRSGAVHPVALLVGLSVLPPVLIAYGLRSSRAVS